LWSFSLTFIAGSFLLLFFIIMTFQVHFQKTFKTNITWSRKISLWLLASILTFVLLSSLCIISSFFMQTISIDIEPYDATSVGRSPRAYFFIDKGFLKTLSPYDLIISARAASSLERFTLSVLTLWVRPRTNVALIAWFQQVNTIFWLLLV
jgi:hypothetical protein